MNVLVTGAAGFIGSHVAEALARRGDTVVGVDNFNDYYSPERKRANAALVEAAGASVIETDVRDAARMAALFGAHNFDTVVHLAAMAGVRYSIEHAALYVDVNIQGTLALLEAACAHGSPHFVFASTSSVYGETDSIPFVESDPCNRPLAPYPATKKAGEVFGYAYHHLYGIGFTALRFFTVYGPRGRPDMMAYKVLDNIFHEREVPLYERGQMYRDWTYIDDIVTGVVAAVDRPLGYEAINLGHGEPVLLAEFVDLIEQYAGRKARLTPASKPDADVTRTYADISKARRLLGYEPKISIQEGVRRFWEWYRDTVLKL
jgi:UDP-glucuronate 4-epimerase